MSYSYLIGQRRALMEDVALWPSVSAALLCQHGGLIYVNEGAVLMSELPVTVIILWYLYYVFFFLNLN